MISAEPHLQRRFAICHGRSAGSVTLPDSIGGLHINLLREDGYTRLHKRPRRQDRPISWFEYVVSVYAADQAHEPIANVFHCTIGIYKKSRHSDQIECVVSHNAPSGLSTRPKYRHHLDTRGSQSSTFASHIAQVLISHRIDDEEVDINFSRHDCADSPGCIPGTGLMSTGRVFDHGSSPDILPPPSGANDVLGGSYDAADRFEQAASSDAIDGAYHAIANVFDFAHCRGIKFRYSRQIELYHSCPLAPFGALLSSRDERPCYFGDGDIQNPRPNFGKRILSTRSGIRLAVVSLEHHNSVFRESV